MADRPLTLRRLLASHRDHRANLLGGVCRRCARARRIREPLRHGLGGRRLPPPPAPIPHRLRPHVEFSRALADANIVGGMQKSCEPAMPTVVRSNGLAPALPALHGAQAKQSVDRRPVRASQLPVSTSDSSCHGAVDSTPVLLPESSRTQTTIAPSSRAESKLPLGGTSFLTRHI